MGRLFVVVIGLVGLSLAPVRSAATETPGADWLADGGDAARTGWQRHETLITPATAKDLALLWRVHLDNVPRQMHALHPALIVGQATTSAGPKEIAVVAGVSDTLFGLDVAQGTLLWSHQFDHAFTPPPGGRGMSALCPGGQTAVPVIGPGEAAGHYVIYAASWDGRLRQVDVATGREIAPPAPFMPPNGKPYALNLANGVIYTTTAQYCGDHPNAVYAFDLATRRVARFLPGGGGSLWGRRGPSVGATGAVFAGVGDGDFDPKHRTFSQSIIAVAFDRTSASLSLTDYFAPPNAEWLSQHDLDMSDTGPVFPFDGHEWLVQSSKECRLWLLDTAALGGADHRTARATTPPLCNAAQSNESAGVWGAISTWQAEDGARWIVAPFWGPTHPAFHAPLEHGPVEHGAVAAFRVTVQGEQVALTPAWISRDMNRADPPIVANGVVFGYGSGESTTQSFADRRHPDGTAGRIADSTHAVLYALEATTGAELWSSGDLIQSWNHFSGLALANGRVYIGTYDGDLYCFGVRALAGRSGGLRSTDPSTGLGSAR